MATVTATKLTVEEFDKLPDPPGGRYELRHGEAVFVAHPVTDHTHVQYCLQMGLQPLVAAAYAVFVEFPFRPAPEFEFWSADVAVVSRDRWRAARNTRAFPSSPEIVIEVLSPSNTKAEMLDRRDTCLAGGALEFWVVDQKRQHVRVTRRDGSQHTYEPGESIPLTSLGVSTSLPVGQVFAE